MSQTLIVELSDEVYAALQREAEAANVSPADVAATSLTQHFGHIPPWLRSTRSRSDVKREGARERFEHHYGSVDLGYATGAENESIDADLAGEYASRRDER